MSLYFHRTQESGPYGQKADSLFLLQQKKVPIPAFGVLLAKEQRHMPREWLIYAEEIFSQLGHALIVRSTFLGEDTGTSSLAGVFTSIELEMPTASALWDCIQTVLHSYAPHRAGTSPREEPVLIQRKITGLYSGVAFSRHPQKLLQAREIHKKAQKRGRIEWIEGPCRALVEGNATPQSCIFGEAIPSELHPFFSTLRRYTDLAERLWKCPIDMEWTWDGEQFWVLQVRSIAAPEAQLFRPLRQGYRWDLQETRERFPTKMTLLGWSLLADHIPHNFTSMYDLLGISTRDPDRHFIYHNGFIYGRSPSIRTLRISPWKGLRFMGANWRSLCSLVRPSQRAFEKVSLVCNWLQPALAQIEVHWTHTLSHSLAPLQQEIASIDTATWEQRADFLAPILRIDTAAKDFFTHDFSIFFLKKLAHKVLETYFEAQGVSPMTLLQWMENDTQSALSLPRTSHAHLHLSWDVADSTLEEAFPNQTWPVLSPKIRTTPYDLSRFPETVQSLYTMLLRLFELDDAMHEYAGYYLLASKKMLRRFGVFLHQIKEIPSPHHIYFLTKSELLHDTPYSLAWISEQRKGAFSRWPTEPLHSELPIQETPIPPCTPWIGASPGVAQGQLCTLEELQQYLPHPEEAWILQTPAPQPELALLFPRLRGMIVGSGGLLSHGLVLAREYHLPTVICGTTALSTFAPGEWVEINGTNGTIHRLPQKGTPCNALPLPNTLYSPVAMG